MTKEPKILVTGGAGFVGQVLVEKLLVRGDKPVLVSRNNSKKQPLVGADIIYGDLTDMDFCKQSLKDVDLVYYLAGYKKNISHHTSCPFDFVSSNVNPLLLFLKAVVGSKVKRIVYLSSVIVGYTEDSKNKLEISDGYVAGKYINELIINSFTKQYPNIDVKIVRSAAVYGPGDNFSEELANFIPAMINKVNKSKDQIEVWGTGQRQMQFIYVDDLADNLLAIADNNDKNLFIVGDNTPVSIKQVITCIQDILNKEIKMVYNPSKPDKPTKLFDFFNEIELKINLKEGLKNTISYHQKMISDTQ
jgi:GDP-L-fucose synthase